MNHQIKAFTLLASVASFCSTAHAAITFSTSTTVSSYLGSPVYTSVAATAATVAQGNTTLAGGAANVALSETFTPSSSFTLNQINILAGVTVANTTLSIHLYDVTGVDKQGSSAFYFPGADLFGGGSGVSFTVPTVNEQQYIFSLDNVGTTDQIALVAGNTYALEIWTPAAVVGNFQWYRGAAVATDGQMMGSHDSLSSVSRNTIAALGLAGGAPRTASLALYAVPEPTAMTLLGLGTLATLLTRRRG